MLHGDYVSFADHPYDTFMSFFILQYFIFLLLVSVKLGCSLSSKSWVANESLTGFNIFQVEFIFLWQKDNNFVRFLHYQEPTKTRRNISPVLQMPLKFLVKSGKHRWGARWYSDAKHSLVLCSLNNAHNGDFMTIIYELLGHPRLEPGGGLPYKKDRGV